MCAGDDPDLRHLTFRIACSARRPEGLALVTTAGVYVSSQEMILSELYPILRSTAVSNNYLRLIFALAKSPDWHSQLIRERYVAKYITIINDLKYHPLPFHLAGFFLLISPPGQVTRCCRDITSEQWWILVSAQCHLLRL